MGKTRTSLRPKISISKRRRPFKKNARSFSVSLREDVNLKEFIPERTLLDIKLIGAAIVQCLIENDPDGVMEIIEGHIHCLNKSKFLKKANVPRSTMYKLFKTKNPTIKTLAKIMHATHTLPESLHKKKLSTC